MFSYGGQQMALSKSQYNPVYLPVHFFRNPMYNSTEKCGYLQNSLLSQSHSFKSILIT